MDFLRSGKQKVPNLHPSSWIRSALFFVEGACFFFKVSMSADIRV